MSGSQPYLKAYNIASTRNAEPQRTLLRAHDHVEQRDLDACLPEWKTR